NVAGAYHSSLMDSAYQKLGAILQSAEIQAPQFAVFSNVTGEEVKTPEEIRRTLQDQVTGTVRWADCMEGMLDRGCDLFVELGPGGVLASLLQRIRKGTAVFSVTDVASALTAAERLQAEY